MKIKIGLKIDCHGWAGYQGRLKGKHKFKKYKILFPFNEKLGDDNRKNFASLFSLDGLLWEALHRVQNSSLIKASKRG